MLALIICYSLCKIYLTLKAWENSKDTQPSDIFLPKTPRSHLCQVYCLGFRRPWLCSCIAGNADFPGWDGGNPHPSVPAPDSANSTSQRHYQQHSVLVRTSSVTGDRILMEMGLGQWGKNLFRCIRLCQLLVINLRHPMCSVSLSLAFSPPLSSAFLCLGFNIRQSLSMQWKIHAYIFLAQEPQEKAASTPLQFQNSFNFSSSTSVLWPCDILE